MKKLLVGLFLLLPLVGYMNNSLQLIPEADNKDKADAASQALINLSGGKDFWSEYNTKAKELDGDLGAQIRAGVFSWNSILNIGVYVIRFLMQVSIVIGAAMLIKSGYSYALVAIGSQDKPEEVSKSLKNAIIGLFVISISYAVIKLLQMAFLN